MRTLVALVALALAGCAGGPAILDVPFRVIHIYDQPADPDRFRVAEDAGELWVLAKLENARRGFCPGPIATLTLRAPDGSTLAELRTQTLPNHDCVYVFEENRTLAPGVWTIEYAGGSEWLGSIVDVRAAE